MKEDVKENITMVLNVSAHNGDLFSRATAFSLMHGVLENGQSALLRVQDLDEILQIWKNSRKP